ncbi:uncharacterized protein LOC142326664 [Lycorma delicatula]|uniref:uncharacterized protein LOC142326664 n=1 Tax=Lycorma delicatula TaxID=130591 RepID=UPI003F50DFD6
MPLLNTPPPLNAPPPLISQPPVFRPRGSGPKSWRGPRRGMPPRFRPSGGGPPSENFQQTHNVGPRPFFRGNNNWRPHFNNCICNGSAIKFCMCKFCIGSIFLSRQLQSMQTSNNDQKNILQ